MAIRLPNAFASRSRTVLLDFERPVDLRPLAAAGVPQVLTSQLTTDRLLVTSAVARSTISDEESIEFSEILIKVPIAIGGGLHLFPVVTFVDHEDSLVRGYLLGFHKRLLRPLGPAADSLAFEGMDLCLAGTLGGDLAPDALPPEQELPLLLWRDYSVPPGADAYGFAALQIEGYERHGCREVLGVRRRHTVAGVAAEVAMSYEINDGFVITRAEPLASSD